MKDLSIVQIVILFASVFIAIVALLIFIGVIPSPLSPLGAGDKAQIKFWGTLDKDNINSLLRDFNKNSKLANVEYIQIPKNEYINQIVNATAAGAGPDVWIMPDNLIVAHKDKITPIAFESYSQRKFLDAFIDGAEIFILSDEIVGLPFQIDPIVLFWNKDLLQDAGIAKTPQTWDEFLTFAIKLTKIDEKNNILQSGAAMGEFSNIKHAKDILTMLILQTGNPIIKEKVSSAGNSLEVVLSEQFDQPVNPAVSSIGFFNDFADVRKISYSWNKTMPEALDAFIQGRLAMYFGPSSEYEEIRKKNANLRFDIADVPQIRGIDVRLTKAQFDALVISKHSKSPAAALELINYLISKNAQTSLGEKSLFVPPLRSLLSNPPKNPLYESIYQASIRSVSWLDLNPEKTYEIFKNMVEFVSSGRKNSIESVHDAEQQLKAMALQIQRQNE